ncbi:hypothetical protein B0A49_07148 [Cryomyces minteri]|uniref:Uncharacterized protein n=2 Tax=Cryomyces minteri TaxID=331657 RepID=A0A4U0X682_9PEZI|nr:hypothetical protein B0A49_08915 [Cryomyces minteri]TKA70916.1 hypothetical protein B0A49_07148 [Cryomyces minteri]
MYKPNTKWTWSFTIISLVQAIASLGLEGYVFAKFQTSLLATAKGTTQSRTIPTYLSLFIFGFLYQLVLVWDALRLKNTIQVIGLCLYNLGLLIYAAVQVDQIRQAVTTLGDLRDVEPQPGGNAGSDAGLALWRGMRPYLIAVPCVIALGLILLSFVAWKLYDEFAWSIYKHISADLRLKRRYLTYQIYIALLKFDFFFFLGFTVQFLVVVVNTSDAEFYITIAAVPITIVLLLLAAFWTRRESVMGMMCIIMLYFAALAYFLFKLVRMYAASSGHRRDDYSPARKSLTTFAAITVLLLVVTIVNACWCTHNFNKGLKPHIAKRKVPNPEDKTRGGYGEFGSQPVGLGQVTSRMTID